MKGNRSEISGCGGVQDEEFLEYVYGELGDPQRQVEIAAHVKSCNRCAEALDQLRRTIALVDGVLPGDEEIDEMSRGLTAEIMERIDIKYPCRTATRLSWRWQAAVGFALVLLGMFFGAWLDNYPDYRFRSQELDTRKYLAGVVSSQDEAGLVKMMNRLVREEQQELVPPVSGFCAALAELMDVLDCFDTDNRTIALKLSCKAAQAITV